MIDIKKSKGEITRARLLKASRELFAKDGYDATGVDQIVQSIGLTSGVFYANFKSKSDLLDAVLTDQMTYVKKVIFSERPDETSSQWVQRIIGTYLSSYHRDHVETSCPLTTMSQELFKLDLHNKTGLHKYAKEFEDLLFLKLEKIAKGKGALAPALIAICVGGIIIARQQKNRVQSDEYLKATQKTAINLIFSEKDME